MSNIGKIQRAASSHRREAWRMSREDEASAGMTVDGELGAWCVMRDGNALAGPFQSQTEAFRWIERNCPSRRYGSRA